jgi:hypothetical protein
VGRLWSDLVLCAGSPVVPSRPRHYLCWEGREGREGREGGEGRGTREEGPDSPTPVPRSMELSALMERSGFTLPMIWTPLPGERCASCMPRGVPVG